MSTTPRVKELLVILLSCLTSSRTKHVCSIDNNVALGKTVSLSSTLNYYGFNWTGNLAVDGKANSTDPDNCQCCSSTNSDTGPRWLTLDLGETYTVARVEVIGRSNGNPGSSFLSGTEMYIRNDSSMNGIATYTDNHNKSQNITVINYTLPHPKVARYISLVQTIQTFLLVCELRVFEDLNLISGIRANISTSMSQALNYSGFNWTSDLAVDGMENDNTDKCKCCSSSDVLNPWWQLNLGRQYLIDTIEFHGRRDQHHSEQAGGLQVFLSNSSTSGNASIFTWPNNSSEYCFHIPVSPPQPVQYITIKRPNQTILTICEIKVLGHVCDVGWFGYDCKHRCHCALNQRCDPAYGTCPSMKCQPGWMGAACDIVCNNGKYGENCNGVCGHCRKSNMSCNHVNGTCPRGCAAGYHGDKCTSGCENGTYGENCTDHCGHCLHGNMSCDHFNGTCPDGCVAGYHGDKCTSGCTNGTYGENCKGICGHCLHGNMSCDHVNGTCPDGCFAGYHGDNCTSVCNNGMYGENCKDHCGHCRQGNMTCENVNGTCPGGCAAGYHGDKCTSGCENGTYGENCTGLCGHCLHGNMSCDHFNGTCLDGCVAGYHGDKCKSDCNNGTYGENCKDMCGHCLQGNMSCDIVNGKCHEGCAAGYNGDICKSGCNNGTYGENCQGLCGHCLHGNMSCDYINGSCSEGFFAGYHGDKCTSVCNNGTYGENCNDVCGHCLLGNKSCDYMDGTCYEGCAAGYHGDQCKSDCENGTYGENCKVLCGDCLYGNMSCDHNNGTCPDGCAAGYSGDNCTSICADGWYGENCKTLCGHCFMGRKSCDYVSGRCPFGCAAGYHGDVCKTECETGLYGVNCTMQCGRCSDNNSCSKTNGTCMTGCRPGYKGDVCITECEQGTFGHNCSLTCGKCKENSCRKENGTCDNGSLDNWTGDLCVEAIQKEQTSFVGPVAGSVSGTACLIIIALALYLFRRRRLSHQDDSNRKIRTSKQSRRQNKYLQEHENAETEETTFYDNLAFITKEGKGVAVHQLYDYIISKKADNSAEFYKEYGKFKAGLVHAHDVAFLLENKPKNRYKGMVAYDHSRVHLKDVQAGRSDYINACYIHGYEKARKFIASQGPTPSMLDDFWQMVWQESTGIIVMLTNLEELGTVKCERYWPDDGEEYYGSIKVTLLETEQFPNYCIKKMNVQKGSDKPRVIQHFHFEAWPDKNVPDGAWSLVQFWRVVLAYNSTLNGPCVVHCSAGVGRTGTYIALDYLYHQAKEEGSVDVFACVETLRAQRVNMVQTKNQYVYLHEALAEALNCGTLPYFSSQFHDWYADMLTMDSQNQETRLYTQYQLYLQSIKAIPVYENGSQEETYHTFKNFLGKEVFVVTAFPKSCHFDEIWTLINRRGIKTVLMLTDTGAANYEACRSLGTNIQQSTSQFVVSHVAKKVYGCCTERTLSYKPKNELDEDVTSLKLFEFSEWTGDWLPGNPRLFCEFLTLIRRWQPHQYESQPVLIVSERIGGMCGVLCLLLNEMGKIKMDGLVNLLQSLRNLVSTTGNFRIVPSYLEYKFCHDVILQDLEQSRVYQNLL